MTSLWHSLINVGIVIGALVTAALCSVDKHPIRNSLLLLVVGACCYVLDISAGIRDGLCAPSSKMAFIALLGELDECGNPYGRFLVIAQILIIGSAVTWLYLAWGAVLKKYEEELENQTDET